MANVSGKKMHKPLKSSKASVKSLALKYLLTVGLGAN
jgi:hypothetical protein